MFDPKHGWVDNVKMDWRECEQDWTGFREGSMVGFDEDCDEPRVAWQGTSWSIEELKPCWLCHIVSIISITLAPDPWHKERRRIRTPGCNTERDDDQGQEAVHVHPWRAGPVADPEPSHAAAYHEECKRRGSWRPATSRHASCLVPISYLRKAQSPLSSPENFLSCLRGFLKQLLILFFTYLKRLNARFFTGYIVF